MPFAAGKVVLALKVYRFVFMKKVCCSPDNTNEMTTEKSYSRHKTRSANLKGTLSHGTEKAIDNCYDQLLE